MQGARRAATATAAYDALRAGGMMGAIPPATILLPRMQSIG